MATLVAGAGVAVYTSHAFAVILQQSQDTHLSRIQSLLSLAQAAVLVPTAPLLGRLAVVTETTGTLVATSAFLAIAGGTALTASDWRQLGKATG